MRGENLREVCLAIPVKTLKRAKSRLSPILSQEQRIELSRLMIADIVEAASRASHSLDVVLVSADDEVRKLAEELGVDFLQEEERGFNEAAKRATSWCVSQGYRALMIVPADLPTITEKELDAAVRSCEWSPSVVISPAIGGRGTNLLLRKPPNAIKTWYDMDSYRRHLAEARENRVRYTLMYSVNTLVDVDTPADLLFSVRINDETKTAEFAERSGAIERAKKLLGL